MVRSGGTKRKSQALLDSDSDSDASGSGSDLEKEMLSLSKKKKTAQITKKVSGSNSSGSDSDWGTKAKGKKMKKKKVPGKRSRRATMSSDDDDHSDTESFVPPPLLTAQSERKPAATASDLEEGEVSSESDDSGSESEFDDGYDENLMGDEEDKKRLSMMTEKEREQEIFKRVEQREAMRTRYDIEKKLRQAKKKDQKKQKKAELSSSKFKMDAKERSKERKKTVEGKVDKKTQAMDELKARREAKKERQEEKEKARIEQEKKREDLEDELEIKDEVSSVITERSTKKKLKASDIYSDDSGSDWDTNKPARREQRDSSSSRSDSDSEPDQRKKPVYVSEVKDLSRIRLSRQKLEKWVHYPFFERLVKGCFVRIGIGQNVREHKSVYRIAEVLSVFDSGRAYSLGTTRTNKSFKVRHGVDERSFRLEFISSQEFTEEEFNRWMTRCLETKVALPTLDDIAKKEKELKDANNYQFKDEDVEHIIQEKQKFKQSPVNYAVKKTQLMKEKEQAQQRGEEDKVEDLTRQIAELDERAKQLDKARSQSIQSISYINERNRKKNVEAAEKAIMEEIKATKGQKVQDPFTRRNTKPMPYRAGQSGQDDTESSQTDSSSTQQSKELADTSFDDFKADDFHNDDLLRNVEDEEDNENLNSEPKIPDALKAPPKMNILDLDELQLDVKSSFDTPDGRPNKVLTTGDLFSAHDFDIQLELDAKLPPNLPIVARPSAPIQEPPQRRSLNLEDYKRKRGLI